MAIAQFLDALAWNWLIGGTDAHAKNYSLLLSGGDVRLAPLYDIASALPHGMHERKLRMAMNIGADYRVALVHDGPLPQAARLRWPWPSGVGHRVTRIPPTLPAPRESPLK